MAKKQKALLVVLMCIAVFLGYFLLESSIPDEMNISKDAKEVPRLSLPLIRQEVVAAESHGKSNIPKGEVKINCSLLGMIPMKEIQVHQIEDRFVYPGGQTIGIYMRTNGILVVGTGVVTGIDGLDYEPALDIVQSGDYIVGMNGKQVNTKDELVQKINKETEGEIVIELLRQGEKMNIKLHPVQTGKEEYKLGIWVRDDTQGIGTLTYVDEAKAFGALGHGISDVDTGGLLQLRDGSLYQAEILSLTKGVRGTPGEVAGMIRYQPEEKLGTIDTNSSEGIFGTVNGQFKIEEKRVKTAFKQEIREEEATILCGVEGKVKEYQAKIEKVYLNGHDKNKSMILKVTDPKLLEETGGIIQGMSGSPIMQNGKLVGAVTHVFVNDPSRGYGIFIDNMLEH